MPRPSKPHRTHVAGPPVSQRQLRGAFLTSAVLLALAGCSANSPALRSAPSQNSSPSGAQPVESQPHTSAIPAPWSNIAAGDNARQLVLNTEQTTADRAEPCFVVYSATVTSADTNNIAIRLTRPPAPSGLTCATAAVPGPFLVPVALSTPYAGQSLTDSTTSLRHPLLKTEDLG